MKKIKFDNYKYTCGAISVTCVKNDCNAFHYNLSVELTLDEQDYLAVSGKITSRIYALGYDRNDGFFIDEKIPFNDTIPSHVQKRLDNMGCTFSNIHQLEKDVIEICILSFNNQVKSKEYYAALNDFRVRKYYAALDDFKVRKEQFMKKFVALKEKFGINVSLDQCVDSDYGTVDTGIVIRDVKYKDGNIEDWVEIDTMFDE